MQAWRGCSKVKSKKKQRSQNGGLFFDQRDGREQALSIQEAKEIFKTAHQVLQDLTQETAQLAGAATSEMLSGIGRCDPWKLLFYLQIFLLMSCYVIWAISFIGPGVNFGGSLPLEHSSGAPLHGSESSSMREQCGELMSVSLCCLRPPALLPGHVRKAFKEFLSASVLVTTPCLLTLLKYLYSEKQSWWWDLKKLVCLALVAPAILFYVCYSLFNRSSRVSGLCYCTGVESELVCCASRNSWKYLQGKMSPTHQNTAFHSCPDWASQQLLISLSMHLHPVVSLKKKAKLKGKQLKEKLIKATLILL